MDTQEKRPRGKEAEALGFLRSLDDPALYEQMVQTLVRGSGRVVELSDDGLILYHKRAELFMIASRTQAGALSLCELIPHFAKGVQLHGLNEAAADVIRKRFGVKNAQPMVMYAYYGPEIQDDGYDIRMLGMEDLDFIYDHYGHADREYLRERVHDGVMLGAYIDGELAAFIGEHVEGAMGLLHVMPRYRRLGLGFALERAAMRRTMQRGCVPFDQVLPGNAASHRLQKRLGFTRSNGMVYWMTDDEF